MEPITATIESIQKRIDDMSHNIDGVREGVHEVRTNLEELAREIRGDMAEREKRLHLLELSETTNRVLERQRETLRQSRRRWVTTATATALTAGGLVIEVLINHA